MGAVALSARRLGADEHVVLHTRTHGKTLALPAAGLVTAGALTGTGVGLIPANYQPYGQVAVALLGLSLALWWAVIPFLRWWTTTYTVTTRRLITRQGILNKSDRDLPLVRINHVSYTRSFGDRVLGCGTLHVQIAYDGGRLVLPDVPAVAEVHATMIELLFGAGPQPAAPTPLGSAAAPRVAPRW